MPLAQTAPPLQFDVPKSRGSPGAGGGNGRWVKPPTGRTHRVALRAHGRTGHDAPLPWGVGCVPVSEPVQKKGWEGIEGSFPFPREAALQSCGESVGKVQRLPHKKEQRDWASGRFYCHQKAGL